MDHWSWAISGVGVTREDNFRSLVQNSLESVNRNEAMTKADGCTFLHLCFGVRSIVPTDLSYFLMVSISIQMSVLSWRMHVSQMSLMGLVFQFGYSPKAYVLKGWSSG